MPNIRMILWGVLAAIIFLNYQTWVHDYEPPVSAASQTSSGSAAAPSAATPDAGSPAAGSPAAAAQSANVSQPAVVPAASSSDTSANMLLQVTTDVLDVGINLKGGEMDRADLLQYPLRKDTPNIPVKLLSYEPPPTRYVVQSGLTGAAGEAAPTHLAEWTSDQKTFVLAPGADELRVPLHWSDGQGLTVTKTFVFKRGQYAVSLEYDAKNDSASPRTLASYAQILRHWEHASRSYFDVETYSFKGPAVYDGTKLKDLNVESDSDAKFSGVITGGWMASLQHQFVVAVVPPAGQAYHYQLQVLNNEYLLQGTGPMTPMPSSMRNSLSVRNCSRNWRGSTGISSARSISAY
jgi:YidC/Oxa1 family membrane protein insertase